MKNYFLVGFLLFVGFYFQSCSSAKESVLEGTYYGVVPCASCVGINTELILNKDKTYKRTELYNKGGRPEVIKPIETTGTYTLNDGILVLSAGVEEMNKFKINSESEIEMVKMNGKPSENLREMFILKKGEKPDNFSLQPIYPKKVGGVGFRATGNEPFWSLEIDFSKNMVFKTMEGDSLVFPISEPTQLENEEGIAYESPNGELKVTILNETCQDDMSGNEFQHKVNIELNSEQISYKKAAGCGNYKGVYRLNGSWTLTDFDGKNLEELESPPSLTFQLAENKIYGFGGCNRIFGEVTFSENTVNFGNLASTKMACAETMDFETKYLQAITGKTMNIQFLSDDVITLSGDGVELEFAREKK